MFGAQENGSSDDAPAINYALKNSGKTLVELGNLTYKINSSINLTEENQKLTCYGSIITNNEIALIHITAHNVIININELRYNTTESSYNSFKGTGVLFSDNSYHSIININNILNVKEGLSFIPVAKELPPPFDVCGIQYSKISFQYINAYYGIYINLLSGNKKGKGLWMNENQFNGGRLSGNYGIYVERPDYDDPQFDYINGNVFNSIGFEGLVTPISMYHSNFNSFRDLRMSETIKGDFYIDIKECQSMIFDIKSHFPYSKIDAKECRQIELSRSFTDEGHGFGFDKMYISRYPGMASKDENTKVIYKSYSSVNMIKKLYYDLNILPDNPISYNDFFVFTHNNDMMTLSNFCEITMYDEVELIVDFKDSIFYEMCSEMTLRYNRYGNTKIIFINGTQTITTINKRGTYKIVGDRDYNISIIPLAIDLEQD